MHGHLVGDFDVLGGAIREHISQAMSHLRPMIRMAFDGSDGANDAECIPYGLQIRSSIGCVREMRPIRSMDVHVTHQGFRRVAIRVDRDGEERHLASDLRPEARLNLDEFLSGDRADVRARREDEGDDDDLLTEVGEIEG